MLRSNSKSPGNHVVCSPEEENGRLRWKGFAEKEGFSQEWKSEWVMENLFLVFLMQNSKYY